MLGNKGTFSLNKKKPFYSWYQYLEGYSEELVEAELKGLENIKKIYDPFGGSGTTMLYASLNGIDSFYSETNPFMRWVTETKINSSIRVYKNLDMLKVKIKKIIEIIDLDISKYIKDNSDLEFSKYYDLTVFNNIMAIKTIIENNVENNDIKNILLLGLVSNIVSVSNMIRRGDLRFATEKELEKKDKNIVELFKNKINEMYEDLEQYGNNLQKETKLIENDVRSVDLSNIVDCVITSPPYLNGTNYIRNTKLELNILGFINEEKSLSSFHSKGIIAGINNVSKANAQRNHNFDFLKKDLEKLEKITYDSRIPRMITGYFDNMYDALDSIFKIIKNQGYLALDIGDSQFSGIHIRTDDYLVKIAQIIGFELIEEEVLRERRSRNGMVLSQKILKFKVNKNDR